jgi:hypothetical protein
MHLYKPYIFILLTQLEREQSGNEAVEEEEELDYEEEMDANGTKDIGSLITPG